MPSDDNLVHSCVEYREIKADGARTISLQGHTHLDQIYLNAPGYSRGF